MDKSILQAEESLQNALESLRSVPLNRQLSDVLDLLAPKGYHPVVELQEDGRKKRRTASIENWTPETGEILISFSRDENKKSLRDDRSASPAHGAYLHSTTVRAEAPRVRPSPARSNQTENVSDPAVQELCGALEEVERLGRSFVALKWFRDEVLPTKGFSWAADQEERQRTIAQAVESGAIVTSKIPNPRSPFPTTTIRLNRSHAANLGGERRFSPVRVHGEPLSATILRDRGAR